MMFWGMQNPSMKIANAGNSNLNSWSWNFFNSKVSMLDFEIVGCNMLLSILQHVAPVMN